MKESQESTTNLELYRVFRDQGAEIVYAVRCCGRLYIGLERAVRCRTCDTPPKNTEIRQESDLDNLL